MSGYRFFDTFVANAAKCRVTDFVTLSVAKMCQNAAKCRVNVSGVHCVPRRVLDSDSRVVRQIALIVPLGFPSAQVFFLVSLAVYVLFPESLRAYL